MYFECKVTKFQFTFNYRVNLLFFAHTDTQTVRPRLSVLLQPAGQPTLVDAQTTCAATEARAVDVGQQCTSEHIGTNVTPTTGGHTSYTTRQKGKRVMEDDVRPARFQNQASKRPCRQASVGFTSADDLNVGADSTANVHAQSMAGTLHIHFTERSFKIVIEFNQQRSRVGVSSDGKEGCS